MRDNTPGHGVWRNLHSAQRSTWSSMPQRQSRCVLLPNRVVVWWLQGNRLSEVGEWLEESVADLGEGPGGPPPLVLDRTEARRAEKIFFWDCPPLLSQGLMTEPSPYLKVWIRHWEYYKLERGPRRTYQTHIGKARQLLFDAEIDIVVYVTDN